MAPHREKETGNIKKLTPNRNRKMKEERICPSHRRFVYEYLKDLNGSAAWIRSGHDVPESTARNNAARVLAKANIKALVRQHLEDRAAVVDLTVDKILREYMRLGLSDLTDVAQWVDGELVVKNSADLTPDVTAAISEISQTTITRGGGVVSNVIKVKLHSKSQALDSLAKHLQLFRDVIVNNNLQVNVSISDLAKLVHEDDSRIIEGEAAAG